MHPSGIYRDNPNPTSSGIYIVYKKVFLLNGGRVI